MKKGVILLLAIVYITLTSGVVVNVHYCMGRIAGVSYGHESDHKCDKCGMEQRNGCCDTEHKLVKADNDHISVKTVSVELPFVAIADNHFPEFNYSPYITRVHYNTQYHSPPGDRSNLRIQNGVFRI